MNPAIVVGAYNRPEAVARLLNALTRADYPSRDVPLVISIDCGGDTGNQHVREIAEQFEWKLGGKRVVQHAAHLGVKGQVFFAMSLADEFGATIYLEDDLGISPVFYKYAAPALEFYDDEKIAGLSLYALWFNGYSREPFVPLADSSDVFFLQIPYTQGQMWTRRQWQRFAAWRARGDVIPSRSDNIHEMFLHFNDDDQFPILTKYLIQTDQYYVYPRVALATGLGNAGAHFKQGTHFFQVPLLQAKESFIFRAWNDSLAVYDSFFEILPDRLNRMTDVLHAFDYDVDLYATKEPRHLSAAYVLTSRRSRAPLRTFGKAYVPQEMNVVEQAPGDAIVLSRKKDLRWDWLAELETRKINRDYFSRGMRWGRRRQLQNALADLIFRKRNDA